jgi:hypothetical protein
MAWIPITEADLLTAISGDELAGLRETALGDGQADPVAPTIARIVSRVRGDIASSGKFKLHVNPHYIHDRLLDAALSLIVMRFMSRPAAAVIDDKAGTRAKAAADAERLLERVARGEFAITDEAGTDQSGSAIRTVSSNPRPFTQAKMKGL